MIDFSITIYEDALSLLLNGKPDIKAEILNQLFQGDPCLEDVAQELSDIAKEAGLNSDKVIEAFEEDCGNLMEYISFNEADISFDYGESVACGDRKMCAFIVACTFDADRYLKTGKRQRYAEKMQKLYKIHHKPCPYPGNCRYPFGGSKTCGICKESYYEGK